MLTLADLRRRARSRLDDLLVPYLWSVQELDDYINDTLRDACIRANLTVQDAWPITFTQKADLTWNSQYALPSGFLEVREVYLASQPENTLSRTSFRRNDQYYRGRPIQKGGPYAFALDQTQAGTGDDTGIFVRNITFIGAPTKADTAMLDISRLPVILEFPEDVPEIDEIWHPDLIYGITGLAYLKRDADTFDPKRSARDLQIFEDRFGYRVSAAVLRERQTEVPLEMYLG